jgi:hypothetical protein
MKILAFIIFVCCCQWACGDESDKKPLHTRIKEAVASKTPIRFEFKDGLRTVSFRDSEMEEVGAVDPISLGVSNVIAISGPREVTVDEAKAIFKRYSEAIVTVGMKPVLELHISKQSEDLLLTSVIESLLPRGESMVLIRYAETTPARIDPRFIPKPVSPKNIRPAHQANPGQPATRPESKSEGSDKPQPESEGRSR